MAAGRTRSTWQPTSVCSWSRIGKAAAPMLDVLMERMKRRKGVRGMFCSGSLPKRRNWRFRYFEGGHPLPNADIVRSGARDTGDAEESEEGYAGVLPHLRRRLGDVRSASRSGDRSGRHHCVSPGAAGLGRADQRDQYAAQALLGGEGRTAGGCRGGGGEGLDPAAGCAAADADALSSGPTSPDHSSVDDVREVLARYDLAGQAAGSSVRAFFERADLPESPGNKSRRQGFLPKLPWPGHTAARSFTAAASVERRETRHFAIRCLKCCSPATTWWRARARWRRRPAISWWWTTPATTGTMPTPRDTCWSGSMTAAG